MLNPGGDAFPGMLALKVGGCLPERATSAVRATPHTHQLGSVGPVNGTVRPDSGPMGASPRPPYGTDLVALLIVVAALAAVPTYQVGSLLAAPTVPVEVDICGNAITSVQFDYTGSSSGYLATDLPLPQFCLAIHTVAGTVLNATISLHNLDGARAHTIESLVILYPFYLAGVSPTLPATIPAGGNLPLEVSFEVPSSSGVYGPPAAILTSA